MKKYFIFRISNELGAGRLGGRTKIDHSVGVVLNLVSGDRVIKGQVWANIHHSLETSDLPKRLCDMMDNAIVLEKFKKKEDTLAEKTNLILKEEEKFCGKQTKSKILRILMKDEEV